MPLHCGHAKGNQFDESKAISPLDIRCDKRFIYSALDGAIYPFDRGDESAIYMVDQLKLDAKFLRDRRADALKAVFDDNFLASASDEDISKLVMAYQEFDSDGRLVSFGHVLARYAEQILNNTQ